MDGEQRRAIIRSVAILMAAVLIIGVIVWSIFFRGNDAKKSTGNSSPSTSQQTEEKIKKAEGQKAEQKPGETKPAPATGPSGQSNAASQNQRPQQLANVGPGNLLPLFISATLGGAALHAVVRRYRLSD